MCVCVCVCIHYLIDLYFISGFAERTSSKPCFFELIGGVVKETKTPTDFQ